MADLHPSNALKICQHHPRAIGAKPVTYRTSRQAETKKLVLFLVFSLIELRGRFLEDLGIVLLSFAFEELLENEATSFEDSSPRFSFRWHHHPLVSHRKDEGLKERALPATRVSMACRPRNQQLSSSWVSLPSNRERRRRSPAKAKASTVTEFRGTHTVPKHRH